MDLTDTTAFNLADHVLRAGRAAPDKVALAMVGRTRAERWSYARLEAAVLGTATGLLAEGLEPGDRVILRLGNEVAFPIAYLAAIAVGIIPVPTSAALTGHEITKVAQALRPRAVLASPGIALPEGVRVIDADRLAAFRDLPPARPVLGDAHRPAYIILTSGTSGRPSLVVHAHRAILGRRYMWEGWYGLTGDDRLAHAGAFNWTYTLGTGLLDPWSVGATALIPQPGLASTDLPLLLKRHDATIFAAAPGVFRQMLRGASRIDVPKLRHGLTAGEKCPEVTRQAWQAATGTALHEAFGQSEISTFISGSPSRPAPFGTLGFAQPGRRVAIVDGDGAEVPDGTPGAIAIHRDDPGVMLEYWEDQPSTHARFLGDWFSTGDTGVRGTDGAITYLGRDDDMLNAGGFRVSPLEVEAAMEEHPGVREAAAVEVAVKADASVIAVFYAGDAVPEAALAAHAGERLARYKCPRLFIRRDALPRNPNGKLLRKVLREAYPET